MGTDNIAHPTDNRQTDRAALRRELAAALRDLTAAGAALEAACELERDTIVRDSLRITAADVDAAARRVQTVGNWTRGRG